MDRKGFLYRRKTISLPHETIYLGIGEVAIGYANDILGITALGSCIGLVIYPKIENLLNRCAVMAHIMLSNAPVNENPEQNRFGPAKYADHAIPILIKRLEDEGFNRNQFHAKMVGGAKLFGSGTLGLRIGAKNAETIKMLLKKENIPLLKSFTGGDTGMSLTFYVRQYHLTVKPTGGTKIVL